jgi:hypothetical protein
MNTKLFAAIAAALLAITAVPAFAVDCEDKLAMLKKPGIVDTELAKETIACYSAVVKANPGDPDAHYGLGEAYFSLASLRKACRNSRNHVRL